MEDPQNISLTYATPAPPTGSGLAAGVWITLAGLALIFLGGCFCIGVMFSLNAGNINGVASAGPANTVFIFVLYLLATACFASAAFVLLLGIRKLISIGRP